MNKSIWGEDTFYTSW